MFLFRLSKIMNIFDINEESGTYETVRTERGAGVLHKYHFFISTRNIICQHSECEQRSSSDIFCFISTVRVYASTCTVYSVFCFFLFVVSWPVSLIFLHAFYARHFLVDLHKSKQRKQKQIHIHTNWQIVQDNTYRK